MRILIAAAGRKRAGPEAALAEEYLARASAGGRGLGFQAIDLIEVQGRPAGEPGAEAAALLKATPEGACRILLDERGAEWSSRQLAEKLARWRDDGQACAAFWIGGPDGAAQALRDQADHTLAFGRQTWPHLLVRAMICEQIYRAVTILSGNPYHRD
ncbi:MAG: 23S rRNA (pseudouridine(1915)-N(3))-methyltransferase RlmH [Hyphomonadaceae bacterium]